MICEILHCIQKRYLMNSEIFFKSPLRLVKVGALSCFLALSCCISANQCLMASDNSKSDVISKSDQVKQKSDKAAQESSEKSDKSDKKEGDKKDAKTADKGKEKEAPPKPEPVIENVVNVQPDELVDKPHDYLGKNVKFTALFSGFNTLALDYKPAMRPSKTHLSMVVYRSKKNKIPLSELKLAMLTPPEKDPETLVLAGLKEGDTLEITGKVFSAALDDPWVDILRLKKIGGSTDDKKADASGKAKINDTKATDSKNDKGNGSKSENESKTPAKN